ncbi:MAG: SDR family NAD(P)-dependent oxidoreductase, partial [Candidatus Binatia bacterium]
MSEAGKVVLVTGASSGLGASTARYLASRGMRVFGTSRRGGDGDDRAAGAAGGDAFPILKLDVRDDGSVLHCVRSVVEE